MREADYNDAQVSLSETYFRITFVMSISDRIRPWILLTETAARGSLASAAQSLGLTLPSASKQIRTLEKETGSVLLDRTKKPAVLTPAALRLLPAAQQAAHA